MRQAETGSAHKAKPSAISITADSSVLSQATGASQKTGPNLGVMRRTDMGGAPEFGTAYQYLQKANIAPLSKPLQSSSPLFSGYTQVMVEGSKEILRELWPPMKIVKNFVKNLKDPASQLMLGNLMVAFPAVLVSIQAIVPDTYSIKLPKLDGVLQFTISAKAMLTGFATTFFSELVSQLAPAYDDAKKLPSGVLGHAISRSMAIGAVIGATFSGIMTYSIIDSVRLMAESYNFSSAMHSTALFIAMQVFWMPFYSKGFIYLRDKFIEKRVTITGPMTADEKLRMSVNTFKAWAVTIPAVLAICIATPSFPPAVSYPLMMFATMFNFVLRRLGTEQSKPPDHGARESELPKKTVFERLVR